MRLSSLIFLSVSMGVMSSCSHGASPSRIRSLAAPSGAKVAITVEGQNWPLRGELFAVDSVGVLVRTEQLLRVRWTKLSFIDVDQLGRDVDLSMVELGRAAKIERLRLLSRFPQGLNGQLLERVLRELGQSQIPDYQSAGPTRDASSNTLNASATTLDALARETASLTARFADRRLAIAEGYRRVGTDFPGMGEHWLNPGMLVSGRLDASRPTLPTYATIGDTARLLGVGFVLTTQGTDSPGQTPGWPDAWHEHSGLLEDESGVDPSRAAARADRTHVWVMHAWTALPNPNGTFVADNWAIPFARLGISSPTTVDANSGRALSLAVGGDAFLKQTLSDALVRRQENVNTVDSLVALERARAVRVAARLYAAQAVTADDLRELGAIWTSLHSALRPTNQVVVDRIFAPPHGSGGANHRHASPTSSLSRP